MSLESLTPTPAAGFDMPLALLSACHQRILQFCDMLERLTDHIEKYGVDLQATETSKLIYKYFTTAGKHHHEDEEQDLFPLMLQHQPELGPLFQQLSATHQQLDVHWQALSILLQDLNGTNLSRLQDQTFAFVQAQRLHLQLENRELLPRAAAQLTIREQETLGQAMAKRRGIDVISNSPSTVA